MRISQIADEILYGSETGRDALFAKLADSLRSDRADNLSADRASAEPLRSLLLCNDHSIACGAAWVLSEIGYAALQVKDLVPDLVSHNEWRVRAQLVEYCLLIFDQLSSAEATAAISLLDDPNSIVQANAIWHYSKISSDLLVKPLRSHLVKKGVEQPVVCVDCIAMRPGAELEYCVNQVRDDGYAIACLAVLKLDKQRRDLIDDLIVKLGDAGVHLKEQMDIDERYP